MCSWGQNPSELSRSSTFAIVMYIFQSWCISFLVKNSPCAFSTILTNLLKRSYFFYFSSSAIFSAFIFDKRDIICWHWSETCLYTVVFPRFVCITCTMYKSQESTGIILRVCCCCVCCVCGAKLNDVSILCKKKKNYCIFHSIAMLSLIVMLYLYKSKVKNLSLKIRAWIFMAWSDSIWYKFAAVTASFGRTVKIVCLVEE